MKILIGYLVATLLLFQACKPSASNTNTPPADSTQNTVTAKSLLSTFKGDFAGSPIYITLNYFNGKQVAGYNVLKGLRRNLQGEIQKDGDYWILTLQEPGDHPDDGKFKIILNKALNDIQGTWIPVNNKSLKEKTFSLIRVVADNDYYNNGKAFSGVFNGDGKSDFTFNQDGSCILQYYEKITDSTFAEQMTVIRGTFENKDDSTLIVSWQKNQRFPERKSTFHMQFNEYDNDHMVLGIEGEGLKFGVPF